jgi:hypothetical protein
MSTRIEGRSRGFFGPLPSHGVWTALGLTRGQFFAILALACLIYVFFPGPLWLHLGRDDFARIVASYAVIPIAIALALYRNGSVDLASFVGGTATVAVLKLLITAGLALILDLA